MEIIGEVMRTQERNLVKNEELSDSLGEKLKLYEDADNNYYIFNDEGDVVGYSANQSEEAVSENDVNTKLIEKDIRSLSVEFLNNIVDDGSCYSLDNFSYIKDTEMYSVDFSYHLESYKTSDRVFMYIDKSGELVSFGNNNEGIFTNKSLSKENLEDVEDAIENELVSIYGSQLKNYSILDKVIDIVNDKLVLAVEVSCDYINEDTGINEVRELTIPLE